jgi:molybdopterin/thiamine biosynthesis adenylyltransferase
MIPLFMSSLLNASVLVLGLGPTAAEFIKNIVLAGIGSLTMVDNRLVQEEDLGSDFFLRETDVTSKVTLFGIDGVDEPWVFA